MPKLNLKPNHKAIRDYYATLQQYEQQGIRHEGAVSSPFEGLLHACAKQVNATLFPQSALDNWHTAVSDFRAYVPDLANKLKELIDDTISKWDIFHYNYALLHHPTYCEKYEMNLKRDLPHIPFAEDFWGFAAAGDQLADLHVNYESVPTYNRLKRIETPGLTVDWRVEKMRLSKDKTQLKYNDFLTLDGIPAEVYEYRLGTRSALEWVVDQYRVKVDRRSGIVNDPNRADQPQYIVDLIGRVITVSLKTVEIVKNLPPL